MTLIEQMLNVQEYGDRGGQMNLERVRKEILDHDADQKRKKKEKEETMTLIERVVLDMFKATSRAVIQQAIDEIIGEFNTGKW